MIRGWRRLAAGVLVDQTGDAVGGFVPELFLDDVPVNATTVVQEIGRLGTFALGRGIGVGNVDPSLYDLGGLDIVQEQEAGDPDGAVGFLGEVLQDVHARATLGRAGAKELEDGRGGHLFHVRDHGVVVGHDGLGVGVGHADAVQGFENGGVVGHRFGKLPLASTTLHDPGHPRIGPGLDLALEHVGLGPGRLDHGQEHGVVDDGFVFFGQEEGHFVDAVGGVDELEDGAIDAAALIVLELLEGDLLTAPAGDQGGAVAVGGMGQQVAFLDRKQDMAVAGMFRVVPELGQRVQGIARGAGDQVDAAVGAHGTAAFPHAGLFLGEGADRKDHVEQELAVGGVGDEIAFAGFDGLGVAGHHVQGHAGAGGGHRKTGSTGFILLSGRGNFVHLKRLLT